MPGFDVLDPHLPLYQNHFVEASAGTGKTFAIENIITRLLLDPDGPDIDQILVVTFTRAATIELKRRIYANIEKRISKVSDPHGKNRLKQALATFDEAKIFTIHSFCFHSLQEYALEVGLSLDQMEESAPIGFVETIVKDYLRTDKLHPQQLELLLKNNFDKLLSQLVQITNQRLPIVGGKSYEQLLASYTSEIKKWEPISEAKFLEDLLALAPSYRQMTDRKREVKPEVKTQLKRFAAFAAGKNADVIDPFLLHFDPSNRLKKATLPSLHYPRHFEQMQKRLLPIAKEANNELVLLADLAEGARKMVEKVVQDEELLFYEDLLQLMAKNVEDPLYAQKIREEYGAVLIDEFQDTDPLQWKIFSTLFATEAFEGPLYLVGDPKQSIYRFRGADIYTYLTAKKGFDETSCHSLECNYRSAPGLVRALNDLFSAAQDFIPLPQKEESLSCPPVKVDPSKKEDEGALIFWRAEKEEQFFPAIVSEMRRLHQEEGIAYHGFAVLVKDRFQADRFYRYCQKVNLPIITKRSYSLVDSQAYPALLELLTALLDPRDQSALAKTLGGPIFGWNYERIAEERESFSHSFYQMSRTLKERGILALFEELTQLCQELFSRQGGLELYSDLLQLVEVIACETSSVDNYLPFLTNLAYEKEADKLKARQIGDENAAQIMTIHASKGLEFEVVFPIGLILPTPHRKQLTPDGTRSCLTTKEDPLHAQELDAEKMRQFYVAATRAKKYLYLPALAEKTHAPGVTPPMDLFLQKLSKPPAFTPLPEQFAAKKDPTSPLKPPPKIEVNAQPIFVHSFTSLSTHEPERKTPPKGDIIPPGLETGILLHKVFEELPFAQAFQLKTLTPLIAPILQNTTLEPWIDSISEMVYHTLHTPLPADDGPFPLSAVDPSKMFKEMEFLYPSDQPVGFIKGFIDLFFEYQGKFYFLDWKSNYLEGYTQPYLERAMQENDYLLQSKLYKRALEHYFSLFEQKYTFGGAYYIFLRGLPDGIYRHPIC
ncbi:MAG: RecBCD enzyme subunit RecB [Chlamydiae bacterium]|nr:RecBCD enzyme subunit RecB [Chlamydiota bacterium]